MSANQLETQVNLERLAAVVRDEIQQARKAWSNALGHAMNAGDALIAVQPKVTERGIKWKKWLRENCFVAPSTAQLYMQLARHRPQIEAELQAKGELSLRGARQLISDARDDEGDDAAGTGGEEDEGETETDRPKPWSSTGAVLQPNLPRCSTQSALPESWKQCRRSSGISCAPGYRRRSASPTGRSKRL